MVELPFSMFPPGPGPDIVELIMMAKMNTFRSDADYYFEVQSFRRHNVATATFVIFVEQRKKEITTS
jgi:hypothetical protein